MQTNYHVNPRNIALSKQVSEFSTPSDEFEVESCTLTIRTKLDHVRPCHTLPTVIKRYKKAHSQLTQLLHKT